MPYSIEKRIFTGDLERFQQEVPTGTARLTRELPDFALTHEVRGFETKEGYAGLPIMQIAVLVRSGAQVLLSTRAPSEQKAGAEQPRLTEGASVLISSSPQEDPEAILAAKLQIATGAVVSVQEALAVAHNNVKGTPYLFSISAADIADPAAVLGMQPGNADVARFVDESEALSALLAERRAMEAAVLQLLSLSRKNA